MSKDQQPRGSTPNQVSSQGSGSGVIPDGPNQSNGAFGFGSLDLRVARGRILLSMLAMLTILVDPNGFGMFRLSGIEVVTLSSHLAYSMTIYAMLKNRPASGPLPVITTAFDLFFATAIAILTEGQTSPAYVFFLFAIMAAGVRSGSFSTVTVTVCSVALYLLVIVLSNRTINPFMMRAVYLAIVGYMIGFIGRQRATFEEDMRDFETRNQRHSIARSLHDGYVQALAGVNLRIESCRELLAQQLPADTMAELTELQTEVAREYDEVRTYIRELAGVENSPAVPGPNPGNPRFEVRMAFAGRSTIGEHMLQIMLEGLRNARRHGQPQSVTISVNGMSDKLLITIDDDGTGFREAESLPWAIASRVSELGGHFTVNRNGTTRLEIEVPNN